MNVDGDTLVGGCDGEVLSNGVIAEGDGEMNQDDRSSITRATRMILTNSGVVWEEVGW